MVMIGTELPKIPDTALVAEATELVREAATPLDAWRMTRGPR